MGLLGQTYIWETIISIILIVTSFYYIFTQPTTKSTRDVFNDIILSRDFLLTIDAMNLTYLIFSDLNYFERFRNNLNIPEVYASFLSTNDLIKNKIIIASNCTKEEINKLNLWYGKQKINKREVKLIFIESNLENIPSYADLLIICGYKNLSNYEHSLTNFIEKGKGIVGFFDVVEESDQATKKLFGIDSFHAIIQSNFVEINIPSSVYQENYYSYKYFYGVPITIYTSGINTTTNNPIGNFSFKNYIVPFEINLTSEEVYFYTQERISVKKREDFNLYNHKFVLSYLDNNSISVSFKKVYNFTSFIQGNLIPKLIDDKESKVFLYQGYYDYRKVPVAILNGTKVAWIVNFDRFNNATEDQKLALLSLILAVSDKSYIYGTLTKKHVLIPFIEVENYDFFEPFSIKFGFSSIY